MNRNVMLAITSLLSIVLMSLHLSDDMVRGFSQPGLDNFIAIVVLVVWLYGTLMVRERLAGLIIMLLGAVCAIAMPILHLRGASIVEVVRSSGGLFFYWTVFTRLFVNSCRSRAVGPAARETCDRTRD